MSEQNNGIFLIISYCNPRLSQSCILLMEEEAQKSPFNNKYGDLVFVEKFLSLLLPTTICM